SSSSDGFDSQHLEIKARNVIALFLFVFGCFGNVSFMIAVRSKNEIRNKHGILLSIVCAAQTVCLFFELLKRSKIAVYDNLTRESCFKSVFIYIVAATYQSIGILIIAIDILISLIAPVRYFHLRHFPYLIYLQIPC
ncbi:hypothetical protein PRIPAC_77557, partial [Pristionchus pacificus]